MTDTITNLLKKREEIKKKKPYFYRTDAFAVKRLGKKWRLPRGRDNKVRRRRKGFLPGPCYGSPTAVKGMHPRGLFEALVSNEKDLNNLDGKKHIVRIRGTVGNRKKRIIIKKALGLNLKVVNPGIEFIKRKEDKKKTKETAKKEDASSKTVPEKKDTKDTRETPASEPKKLDDSDSEKKDTSAKSTQKTEPRAKQKTDKNASIKPTRIEAANMRSRKSKDK